MLSQDWRAALTDLGVAQVMENTARTAAGGSNLSAGGWARRAELVLYAHIVAWFWVCAWGSLCTRR